MVYTLNRVNLLKHGNNFDEIILDLWNHEFETGYEIKVTLYKSGDMYALACAYLKALCGKTYDISRWDLIIRNVKQKQMKRWVIYD